jgi:hypothetical protein
MRNVRSPENTWGSFYFEKKLKKIKKTVLKQFTNMEKHGIIVL